MEEKQEKNPEIQENNRNPDGTFKQGVSGNPKGRPKGQTLKEYMAERFRSMTDEEKEEWLKDIAKSEKWRMAEGNPKQDNETKVSGDITINLIKYDDNNNTTSV